MDSLKNGRTDPMPNLLAKESSLYLRQHAEQPVQWMPWGNAAFEKARQDDKPLIVSIGYASCHWCHAMSRESFADEYVASIMNRHFICIKVDREERPDVDQTYMDAVRQFNQSAGWPLHAFCLPDGQPFWGGTYFPKDDLGQGIVPWPLVLMRISEHYKRAKTELIENARNVLANLEHANHAECSTETKWNNSLLLAAAETLCKKHDDENGGFTQAPKFPSPMKIDFLLTMGETESVRSNAKLSERVDHCINRTLDSMVRGSLFDHVGGGFFRYAVDEKWQIPHFEKMLCDNALLLSTYSRAYRKYRTPSYRKVVENALRWLLLEMGDPSHGFCSTLSANYEGREGGYYLWDAEELNQILGSEDSIKFKSAHDLDSLPEQDGYLPRQDQEPEMDEETEKWFGKLLQSRETRKHLPPRDSKRITSWNALALKALVDASIALQRKEFLKMAFQLADWMKSHLLDEDGQVLSSRYEETISKTTGFLDDYAFWAEALLALSATSDWIEPGSSRRFLEDAEDLARKTREQFRDEQSPGCYFAPKGLACPSPSNKKFWYDNAVPAGNSSMLRVFSALSFLIGEEPWEKEYQKARAAYSTLAGKAPDGIAHALTAITEHETGLCLIKGNQVQIDSLMKELAEKPQRPIFVTNDESIGEKLTLCVGKTGPQTFENCDLLVSTLFDR